MRLTSILFQVLLPLLAIAGPRPLAGQQMPEPPANKPRSEALTTDEEKMQYAIGVQVARNFLRQGMKVDADLVIRGMQDVFANRRLLVSEKDLMMAWQKNNEEARRRQARDRRSTSIDNKQASESFLAANAKNEGMVTLPSGLQYKILKAGTGSRPTSEDTVYVRYRGTLIDGTEFLASEPDVPAKVPLQGTALIAGLTEALKLMPAGSQWMVYVPPHLGYGERGHGMYVGPNCVLVFELELLDIKPTDKPAGKDLPAPTKDKPEPKPAEPAKTKDN